MTVGQLKADFRRFTRAYWTNEVIAMSLALFVGLVLFYLGGRVESQKKFYRAVLEVQYEQQERLRRVLVARMHVMKLVAQKVGATEAEIREVAGPDAFNLPENAPLDLGDL